MLQPGGGDDAVAGEFPAIDGLLATGDKGDKGKPGNWSLVLPPVVTGTRVVRQPVQSFGPDLHKVISEEVPEKLRGNPAQPPPAVWPTGRDRVYTSQRRDPVGKVSDLDRAAQAVATATTGQVQQWRQFSLEQAQMYQRSAQKLDLAPDTDEAVRRLWPKVKVDEGREYSAAKVAEELGYSDARAMREDQRRLRRLMEGFYRSFPDLAGALGRLPTRDWRTCCRCCVRWLTRGRAR
jgi:hypothetical protein